MTAPIYAKLKTKSGHDIIIDVDNYERLSKFNWVVFEDRSGSLRAVRYFPRDNKKQRFIYIQHEIVKLKKGFVVDHINRNPLDNRRKNLRLCKYIENARNVGKRKGETSSKYKGVYFNKLSKKYTIQFVSRKNKRAFIAGISSEKRAALIRDLLQIDFYGEIPPRNLKISDFFIDERNIN